MFSRLLLTVMDPPFCRASTSIGIAVCRKLIDLMGGDIVLDSDYDSGIEGSPGARFSVILNRSPLAVEQSEDDGGEKQEEDEEDIMEDRLPETCRVLFVDDDALLRRLFSRSISKVKPKWIIREAASGETALEMATQSHYDIIFVDQYMTSIEKQLLGTETVRALRSRGVTSRICGLSANDMEDAFLEAGADMFLLKPLPCKPNALYDVLRQILRNNNNKGISNEPPSTEMDFVSKHSKKSTPSSLHESDEETTTEHMDAEDMSELPDKERYHT